MSSVTHKKIEKNFFNVVAKIISEEINDSRISFTTVTGVELSRDKSHLKIFLIFNSYPKQSLDAIQKAKGFIRSEISRYTNTRRIPEIYLLLDDTWEKGKKIDKIFEKINKG